MKRYSGKLVSLLAGAMLLCATALGQNGGLRFTLTDLGTFGGVESRAYAINNKGQIVGTTLFSNGDSQCFVWKNGSAVLFTYNSQSRKCEARAISEDGVIGGSLVPSSTNPWSRAFYRTPGGTISIRKPSPGDEESFAYGVIKGRLVGESYSDTNDRSLAAMWDSNGVLNQLGGQVATAINPIGQIVGYGPGTQAWVWYNGTVSYLTNWNGYLGTAWAINNNGYIAGGADGTAYGIYPPCAALWNSATPASPAQNLGCNFSAGVAISNDNWIVTGRSTYWCEGCASLSVPDPSCSLTHVQDLLDASGTGWQITMLTGINDSHQIVGWAHQPSSLLGHAILLTPNNLPLCYPN
jgi:probable HAF family extracellular repeat protein